MIKIGIIILNPDYELPNIKEMSFVKTGWDKESIKSVQGLWRFIESEYFNGFALGRGVDV